MSNQTNWFVVPYPVARPRVRLLCFPHAGGSATMFHRWAVSLGGDVEILAVELPGRGSRLRERPYRCMSQLIPDLVDASRHLLATPYAIFGHSLGATVGFELVRALRRRRERLPAVLFVSARPAPQLPHQHPPIHHLPQAAFLRALEKRFGTADSILHDPEMAAFLYPSLQADIELLETWSYQVEAPIPVHIATYGGSSDLAVAREGLDAWREQTSKSFTIQLLEGGHFYLSKPVPLLSLLRNTLAEFVR